jgi:hypothetical protein
MQEGETARFLVKGDVRIYDGTMVCLDSNGWAVPGADVAGYKFVGIAQSGIDNRLRPDGDQSIQVRKKGEYDYQMLVTTYSSPTIRPRHCRRSTASNAASSPMFLLEPKTHALKSSPFPGL